MMILFGEPLLLLSVTVDRKIKDVCKLLAGLDLRDNGSRNVGINLQTTNVQQITNATVCVCGKN